MMRFYAGEVVQMVGCGLFQRRTRAFERDQIVLPESQMLRVECAQGS
jgi:hypothetical protein